MQFVHETLYKLFQKKKIRKRSMVKLKKKHNAIQ